MKIFNSRKTRIGRHVFLATLAIASIITAPRAQQLAPIAAPVDRVALYQALLDLTNPWTVMCIAAHPDDEDGTSLIVMRRKYGAHTVSLFSTFGEGGQNAIGPELYEELGAIRARETMAAAEIQGSEPHFLGLKDFGYSKSADEAFKFWGHDEALRRMVLQIRKLRPDVIITNHSVTSNDHGHHQATARLELEAFDAAADPKRFPEQLSNDVTVWQVQRLFVRARGNAAQNPDRQGGGEQVVIIDPNERDPVRNTVFAEEALRALQKHATQGPWPKTFAEFAARFRAFTGQSAAPGQLPLTRYRLVREAKGAQPLTKDADSFLAGLVVPAELVPRLAPLWGDQSMIPINERELVLPRLLALAKSFHQANRPQTLIAMPRVAAMAKRLDAALAAAAGISVAVVSEAKTLVPGTVANFDITVTNHGNVEAQLGLVDFGGMGRGAGRPASTRRLPPGQSVKIVREFDTPKDAAITVPHQEHLYDGREFGEQFTATADVTTKGGTFQVPARVSVDIAPPVEIVNVRPSPIVITPQTGNVARIVTLDVFNRGKTNVTTSIGAFVAVNASDNTPAQAIVTPLTMRPEEHRELKIALPEKLQVISTVRRIVFPAPAATPVPEATPLPLSDPKLILRATDKSSNEVSIRFVFADAHVPSNLNVGYVRGFDYSLSNALNALGVESKELSVDEVKTADLSKYTSIIVDNRVYESQPELIAANQKLLDYASAGGTLIVFYHKSDEWNPDERRKRPQLAPYKLILGNERITDETAPISFIEPEHPLLNFPNKMGQEDFANWIQERGLYYPKDWDPQYHALLQSNDPGEAPLNGGLLVADYGRGHYIYTSMVWYRELRAGVPGAYRMLANMISYGQAKGKG
jgi:LmbE family N-acetylglucosaminyl deacetylase